MSSLHIINRFRHTIRPVSSERTQNRRYVQNCDYHLRSVKIATRTVLAKKQQAARGRFEALKLRRAGSRNRKSLFEPISVEPSAPTSAGTSENSGEPSRPVRRLPRNPRRPSRRVLCEGRGENPKANRKHIAETPPRPYVRFGTHLQACVRMHKRLLA